MALLSIRDSSAMTTEEAVAKARNKINLAIDAVEDENWRLTKKYAQELIDKYPDMDFGYLFMGLSYDDRGKHKKAIEYYEKALELHPNDPDTYQNMGYAYFFVNRQLPSRTASAASCIVSCASIFTSSQVFAKTITLNCKTITTNDNIINLTFFILPF